MMPCTSARKSAAAPTSPLQVDRGGPDGTRIIGARSRRRTCNPSTTMPCWTPSCRSLAIRRVRRPRSLTSRYWACARPSHCPPGRAGRPAGRRQPMMIHCQRAGPGHLSEQSLVDDRTGVVVDRPDDVPSRSAPPAVSRGCGLHRGPFGVEISAGRTAPRRRQHAVCSPGPRRGEDRVRRVAVGHRRPRPGIPELSGLPKARQQTDQEQDQQSQDDGDLVYRPVEETSEPADEVDGDQRHQCDRPVPRQGA